MSRAFFTARRVTCLDGLRGVAAAVVIVSHLVAGFFPALYFGAEGGPSLGAAEAIAASPLFVFYSGTFAVYVFFVLSGYVIAASSAKTECPLGLLVATRYLRLAIPVLASVLGAYILTLAFPGATQQAAEAVGHWWLGMIYKPVPYELPVTFALREALGTVFWSGVSYYNNVLWTMRVEFAGSVAIYVLYRFLSGRFRIAALFLAALAALFAIREWPTNLLAFFLGALIYEAVTANRLKTSRAAGVMLLLAGLLLGGLPFSQAPGSAYQTLAATVELVSPSFSTVRALGAACLMLCLFVWDRPRRIFDSWLARFLGRISFGLYLVHLPILAIGLSKLYVVFGRFGAWPMTLSVGCYLLTCPGLAYLFTVLVDEPTVRALSRLKKAWIARREAPEAFPEAATSQQAD